MGHHDNRLQQPCRLCFPKRCTILVQMSLVLSTVPVWPCYTVPNQLSSHASFSTLSIMLLALPIAMFQPTRNSGSPSRTVGVSSYSKTTMSDRSLRYFFSHSHALSSALAA